MNVKTISRSVLGGLLSAIVISQPAFAAGTLSGQIGVRVTLGSGCSVSNVRNGENNRWGNINFGAYGDLANSIDAEVTGSGGGSALTVTCTEDLDSTLTLDGGQFGDAALRYMKTPAVPSRLPIGSIQMPPAVMKFCPAARYLSLAPAILRLFLFLPASAPKTRASMRRRPMCMTTSSPRR